MKKPTTITALTVLAFATLQARPPEPRPWGPEQATGAPDTNQAGDLPTAWASLNPDGGPEWLEVEFEKPTTIAEVRIRETFNPGEISRVVAIAGDSREFTIWEGRIPRLVAPAEMVAIPSNPIESKRIRIHLDATRVPGWNEIDAVELVGKDGSRQWAKSATASSTFADAPEAEMPKKSRGWGPEQATGPRDTMEAGDFPTAWASLDPDGGMEWLLLEYENPIDIAEVRIHETFNPGAISKVVALDGKKESVLWEGQAPPSIAPVEMVVKPANPVTSKSLKIHIDSNRVPGWNEIDAVELVGRDGSRQWAKSATASSSFADQKIGFVNVYEVSGGKFSAP